MSQASVSGIDQAEVITGDPGHRLFLEKESFLTFEWRDWLLTHLFLKSGKCPSGALRDPLGRSRSIRRKMPSRISKSSFASIYDDRLRQQLLGRDRLKSRLAFMQVIQRALDGGDGKRRL